MGTSLVLEPSPCIVASDHQRDLVDPSEIALVVVEHLHPPAVALGVGAVHREQVAGEQVGFLAAFGSADLHDHRPPGIGIGRNQQGAHLEGEGAESFTCDIDLVGELAALAIVSRLDEGFGRCDIADESVVLGESGHHRLERAIATRDLG